MLHNVQKVSKQQRHACLPSGTSILRFYSGNVCFRPIADINRLSHPAWSRGLLLATTRSAFAQRHPSDRAFFATFLVVCWIGVAFGFFPASSARVMGRADYVAPLILHIHAVAFIGWLALLTLQILLIRNRLPRLHMKLGPLGLLLVPIMAYSGIAAEMYSQRFYIQRDNDGLDFFILPLMYTVVFPTFALAGLLFARRDPAAHKRLILMATTVIVGAAYARWWGEPLATAFGDDYWGMLINSFTGTNVVLALALGYDVVTRGRPHRVYLVGIPAILVTQLLCSWV